MKTAHPPASRVQSAELALRRAPFSGPFRYTRVWHGDGWRVVAGHVSAVTIA